MAGEAVPHVEMVVESVLSEDALAAVGNDAAEPEAGVDPQSLPAIKGVVAMYDGGYFGIVEPASDAGANYFDLLDDSGSVRVDAYVDFLNTKLASIAPGDSVVQIVDIDRTSNQDTRMILTEFHLAKRSLKHGTPLIS